MALHLVQMKVPVQDEVLGREVVKRVPVDLRSKTEWIYPCLVLWAEHRTNKCRSHCSELAMYLFACDQTKKVENIQ